MTQAPGILHFAKARVLLCFLGLGLLGSCAKNVARKETSLLRRVERQVQEPVLPREVVETDRDFRPHEIFQILEDSPISYDISSSGPIEPKELGELVGSEQARGQLDPFLLVRIHPKTGKKSIRSAPPKPGLAEVFERAGRAFVAREFSSAARLYAKAIEMEPDYAKSYTYLGNTYFFLQEFSEAEVTLLRAIELNPVDYQAYLFLSDTYDRLGEYTKARDAVLMAFYLNRSNPVVLKRLQLILARFRLQVRQERFAPPIRLTKVSEKEVKIDLDSSEGVNWLAMGACLACWSYEDACRSRARPDADPLNLAMHRECLLNHAASVSLRKDRGEELSVNDHFSLKALQSGYLDAILLWEVGGKALPALMLLLPDDAQAHVLEYIERFVLISTELT